MRGIQGTPEHVADAIARVKYTCHQALVRFLDRIPQLRFALIAVDPRLLEEGLLINHTLVQRPRVFGKAQRRERSERLCQVDRVHERMRDGHRRRIRIDVDRRRVDPDVIAIPGLDAEAHDALHAIEGHHHPRRVLAALDDAAFAADLEACFASLGIHGEVDRERTGHRPVLARRPMNVRLHDAFAHDNLVLLTADVSVLRARTRRPEREAALRALEIGHAHA